MDASGLGIPICGTTPLSDLSVEPLVGPVLPNVVKVAVKVHEMPVGPALQQRAHHLPGLLPVSPHHSEMQNADVKTVGPDSDSRIMYGEAIGQGQRKPQVLAFRETELGDTHKFLSLGTHRRPWFSRTMTGGTRGRVTSFLLSSWVNKGGGVLRTPSRSPPHLPTLKPQSHHNKHRTGEELGNSPSNFQGQRPRAV